MSKTSVGLMLASLLLVAGSAFADSFTFLNPGGVTWNGVYVNPYQANNNTNPQDNPLTIYCDDWNTDFSGTPTWNANVYALTAANASNFKYGNTTPNFNVTLNSVQHTLSYSLGATPAPFTRYVEAAYLDQQFENEQLSGDTDALKTTRQKELAAAMWTLFVDASHVDGLIGAINSSSDTILGTTYHYADDVSQFLAQAEAAVIPNGSFSGAEWDVIVPVGNNSNGGPMQEFLVHDYYGSTVPEPSAVILLGTVIGYLGLTKLRKRGQVQS
jgi:hypothetical protein